jgi:hypothetical protein
MDEKLFANIAMYGRNLGTTVVFIPIYHEKPKYFIKLDHLTYFNYTIGKAIDLMVNSLSKAIKKRGNLFLAEEQLKSTYFYCFNKGVELTYNIRLENNNNVFFTSDDLGIGLFNEVFPEQLQLEINKISPKINTIFHETLKYVQIDDFDQMDFKDLIKAFLMGAAFLGFDFCVRSDIND